ncbi:MAG TPA: DUF2232 domain-containing protein [bacterium]|nr:DUF2232 domain-containing protein [bacterium]
MRTVPAARRDNRIRGGAALGFRAQRHPTRGLTEGAALAALTVIVGAVGLIAPPVAVLLAPLPIMLLVIRWGLRIAVLASVVATLLLLQFFGPLSALSSAALFAPLGLTMGWGVRRGLAAPLTILAGAAGFFFSTIATVAVATAVLHQDLIGQVIRSQVLAMQTSLSVWQRLGVPSQKFDELRTAISVMPQFLHTALPAVLALGTLLWAYLCYTVARAVLRRVGHELPAVPPLLAWRIHPLLVSAMLWITAGLSLLSHWVPPAAGPALNAVIAGFFVFGFQGALVGVTWMNRWEIPRFAQVMAGILVLGNLLPGLAVIGILDTWFDYRRLAGPPAPLSAPVSPPTVDPGAGRGAPRGVETPRRPRRDRGRAKVADRR